MQRQIIITIDKDDSGETKVDISALGFNIIEVVQELKHVVDIKSKEIIDESKSVVGDNEDNIVKYINQMKDAKPRGN